MIFLLHPFPQYSHLIHTNNIIHILYFLKFRIPSPVSFRSVFSPSLTPMHSHLFPNVLIFSSNFSLNPQPSSLIHTQQSKYLQRVAGVIIPACLCRSLSTPGRLRDRCRSLTWWENVSSLSPGTYRREYVLVKSSGYTGVGWYTS